MKRILIFLVFNLVLIEVRSQKLVGIGLGFDWVEGFNKTPIYSDKDLNISFSNSWKLFVIEARQGLRYLEGFNTLRYNTYALLGVTSPKEKFFAFEFLMGPTFSFVNGNHFKPYRRYFNQVNPTIKTSFYLRLNKKNNLYAGLDCLLSQERTKYSHKGGERTESTYVGSLLISINYLFLKKQKSTAQ